MTHPGQRLSALIDGELDSSERDRVVIHVLKCGSCRDEVAALRIVKRRTGELGVNVLGEAAAAAGLAGLTGRLMGLVEMLGLDDAGGGREGSVHATIWPPPAPAGGWPGRDHGGQDATAIDRGSRPDQRAARYFLAGSLAVFLAGLGTAAFIVGGEPQARAPAPAVTPSIDVLVQRTTGNAPGTGFRPAAVRSDSPLRQPLPASAARRQP